ncbi:MAG: RsmD family RNA methyltransferase [Bdellovibrionaceae bacterium]|nr:RsmD family RNA methyltransferase [Pseudobdellovibrionaceae bacterium]
MSSINLRPTFHYSQPDAYRFSHDSVFLAQMAFDRLRQNITRHTRLLDLCAGCGIIGLDFLYHCRSELGFVPRSCDFVEVQNDYVTHFHENARRLAADDCELRFLEQNYAHLLDGPPNLYDFVLCNPPYFRVEQGSLSPSAFKNRCRFFLDSDFQTLLESIVHTLKTNARAYVLLRDLNAHGWSPLTEAAQYLGNRAQLQIIGDVRGTPVVELIKV